MGRLRSIKIRRLCRLIAGCGLILSMATDASARPSPFYSYRYRITLAVRDHGRLITTSNVVQVTEYPPGEWGGCFPNACLAHSKICGEATALQLSNGKYLLALMNGSSLIPGKATWLQSPTRVLLHRLGLSDWGKDPSGLKSLADGSKPVVLEDQDMPDLVVVRDKSNPLSFARASGPSYDPEWLGEGITFQSITLQATKDEITTGRIASIFPWLLTYDDGEGYRLRKWDGKKRMGFKVKQFMRCD